MKKLFLFFSLVILGANARSQSLSINTDGTSAHTSAILDVKSTTKGMLVPRMTSAQRIAIPTPANGLMVYDTDTNSFWYFKGASWTNLAPAVGGGGQLTLPFDTTVSSLISPFTVRNTYGSTSVAIKAENLGGNGFYGYTYTGKGVYGYANGTGSGIEGYSSAGMAVRAISGTNSAIEAIASGIEPTIKASSVQGDGIYGTTSTTVKAGVKGEANGSASMGVYGLSSAANGYGVRGFSAPGTGVYGQTNIGYGIVASANSGVGLRTSSTSGNALEVFGKLKLYGSAINPQNGAVLTSDAEGNATWKLNKVAFRTRGAGSMAYMTNTNPLMNVEEYDYPGYFNTTTGQFTAPVTGVYSLGAFIEFELNNDIDDNLTEVHLYIKVVRNGTTLSNYTIKSAYTAFKNGSDYSWADASASGDLRLQAGDIVKLDSWQDNTGENTIQWKGVFYGHLVFAD